VAAVISELKRRKSVAVFHRLDANGNGVLERNDFSVVCAGYIEQGGWAKDSAKAEGMRALFDGWWDAILAAADIDKDGVITADEFADAAATLGADASDGVGPMLFDAFDGSGDGLISPVEYRVFLSLYGVDAAQADETFARLDLDGDGRITREEFSSLFMEFVDSEDEDAPGNWLFGPY
jgi:Ca2+-binding EF-hand superfamily protein